MLLVPFLRGLARHLHLGCLALTAMSVAAYAQTNTPSAADGFDPNIDGTVFAMVAQRSDGKILVVGQFANVQPNGGPSVTRNNIARFNADGSLDTSFDPNADGAIRAVVVQPLDRKIIIAGDFTHVGGNSHNYIARLNADGTPDESFTASIGKSIDPSVLPTTPRVMALALQGNGSVLVGGTFGSASSANVAAVQRNNLVRFGPTGALDATYNPNPNSIVLSLAVQTVASVEYALVGGGFTQFGPAASPTARLKLARLNGDGTVDPVFTAQTDDGVTVITRQPDGRILLGGFFTSVTATNAAAAETHAHIARLNSDGSMDANFKATVGGSVAAITIAPDGGILVGGHFTQVFNNTGALSYHNYIARFANDGTTDDSFGPYLNSDVNAIVVQPDNTVVAGGLFTRITPVGTSTNEQAVRNHIARFLPNGALDKAFVIDSAGRVLASVTQATDSKIIVGGTFTNIGDVSRTYLARLNADGTVDTTFYPRLNGPVYAVAYDQTHNQIVIGGAFTSVGPGGTASATPRNHIARLNLDGTLDTSFDPNLNGRVASILMLSDGSMLVGGDFSTATPNGATTSTARNYILKLTSSGAVDTAFNPSANSTVNAIAVQSDGKFVIGGKFTGLQPGATGSSYTRYYLARLNTDGSVDTGYAPGVNNYVTAIAIQSDDSAVIAGRFGVVVESKSITGITRNYLVRFDKTGAIDTKFDPNANNIVLTLALQGTQIVVGGAFTTLQPNGAAATTPAYNVARLNTDGTIDNSFKLNPNQQTSSRVDFLATQKSGDLLVGGTFTSVTDASGTRVPRSHLAKVTTAGTLDSTFDPHPAGSSNTVNAISLGTDSGLLVGGAFSDLGGVAGPNIARYFPEGTPNYPFNAALSTDQSVKAIASIPNVTGKTTQLSGFEWFETNGTPRATFNPTAQIQGSVNASIYVPADNSVIVAGTFTDLSGATAGGMLKFKADGTVDTTYKGSASGIAGMILQPADGKLIIYGSFTTVDGTAMNYIARLNSDGTLDTAFNPNANAAVNAAVLQSDGLIVIGGQFTSLTPGTSTSATATTRNYAARLNSDGSIDTTFNPNLNNVVHSIALQADGRLVFAGGFTTTQPGTDTTATTRNFLLRFNKDGTLDQSFDPNAGGGNVYSVAVEADDQKLVVAGEFTTLGGNSYPYFARLNTNGTVDTTFSVGINTPAYFVTTGSDKTITISGQFTTVTEAGGSTAVSRYHVARMTEDGKLTPFNPGINGTVYTTALAADNSVLVSGSFSSQFARGIAVIGGAFNSVGGVTQKYLAELNADGSVTSDFQPVLDQPVSAVLALADGRFLAAGSFTTISGTARPGIARFTSAGTLDSSFAPTVTGPVESVALQPDGKYLVGTSGTSGLVRLNDNGSVDSTFSAGLPFAPAVAIVVQSDGKIVVAGPGSGVPSRIARLNSDGSVDPTFPTVTLNSGGAVQTLTLQANGSIIVAGTFSTIGGLSYSNLARLTSSGAVDTTFNPNVNGPVSALALQLDGRLLIGGSFTNIGGLARYSLARLASTSPAEQTLAVSSDGKTITWVRRGTTAEAAYVQFYYSTDHTTWTALSGPATHIGTSSDWQLTGLSLPVTGPLYIRGIAIIPTNAGKSTALYQSEFLTNLSVSSAASATVVASVVSSSPWDSTHYVWTVDSAGVMRIADVYSSVTFESGSTVLVNGGTVGSGITSGAAAHLANLSTRASSVPIRR